MMEKDRRLRLLNQRRLRELVLDHGSEVTVFCGHDVREFERLAGRPIYQAAQGICMPPVTSITEPVM
jgi:hypothetical protein